MYNFDRLNLPDYVMDILNNSKGVIVPKTREELISLSMGKDGYDAGAKILMDFLGKELKKFDTENLNPLGRKIIKMFYDGASVQEFTDVIPMRL